MKSRTLVIMSIAMLVLVFGMFTWALDKEEPVKVETVITERVPFDSLSRCQQDYWYEELVNAGVSAKNFDTLEFEKEDLELVRVMGGEAHIKKELENAKKRIIVWESGKCKFDVNSILPPAKPIAE